MEKIGVVDVGGGVRGIYGAGVLDYFMDHEIDCDYFIGVSAGSANGIAFLARQPRRNYLFYNIYSFRKEYMSMTNFLKNRCLLDSDYIYGTLSNDDGESPLDYETLMAHPSELEIVSCDAETGKPIYFPKKEIERNHYDFLKCSSCVPAFNQPYPYKGHFYYDGGMVDPIPFQRAFDQGCTKVIVILTRPVTQRRNPKKDQLIARAIPKAYQASRAVLENRASLYNRQIEEALSLEELGNVCILAPKDIFGLKTLTKDHERLDQLYQAGYLDAKKAESFIRLCKV